MSTDTPRTALREVLSRQMMPVFSVFFFWSFGTGGLWLVRPLFAFEIGGTFLLVALISATSAMPRVIVGPITGYLTDRFGRRPFVVIGAMLHITALTGDFFVQEYYQFLLLELVAGTGIASYTTSSNVLMADATRTATRGRAVAARQVSTRLGTLAGPAVAGIIASLFGLRYVFLFIALTKVMVIVVTLRWIREFREPRPPDPRTGRAGLHMPDLTMFRNRAFLTLAIGTLALGLVNGGTGVFRTLFPPQLAATAGLDTLQVGNLIAVAGLLGLLASVPAGMATDRYGRKRPLVVGLLVTAVAVYMMAVTGSFASALAAVVVFGAAEAIGSGAMQVYAMDQAPEEKRGSFLGVSSGFSNVGQITGPLVIGGIADAWGFRTAFTVVVAVLVAGAAVMAAFATETGRRTRG